jgi:magnesium chelatase subunit I
MLVGKAVREIFQKHFPDPLKKRPRVASQQGARQEPEDPVYGRIIRWFEAGNRIEVSDEMPLDAYRSELEKVDGLRELSRKHASLTDDACEFPSLMEFVLDGLHQYSKIAKDELDHATSYKDLVGSIFSGREGALEED